MVLVAAAPMLAGIAHAGDTGDVPADNAKSDSAKEPWGEVTPPSGYVPGKQPVADGQSAYNWTQMGYGGLVVGVMGLFMVLLVRRVSRTKS